MSRIGATNEKTEETDAGYFTTSIHHGMKNEREMNKRSTRDSPSAP